jgi:hypothetical protein
MANLTIPAPEFELRADVWLNFKGVMIPTYIRSRVYSPDKSAWFYRVKYSGQWHKASELSDRSGEAA